MAASEKREYKSEEIAKRQQRQWQKRGCKVTRRKNVLYIQKTWRQGKGGKEVEMCLVDQSKLSRGSWPLFDSGNMACGMYTFGSKTPTEPHSHPNTDVVEYTVQGKGIIWVNARSYAMDQGTAIHMPVDAWHTYQCDGDEPFVFFGALDKRRTVRRVARGHPLLADAASPFGGRWAHLEHAAQAGPPGNMSPAAAFAKRRAGL